MHEMGIAMEVANIAAASIPEHMKGAKIEAVNIKVGRLSAVVPDSLRFCFDIIIKDTPHATAKLNIEQVPVVTRCEDCSHEWTVTEPVFVCTKCNSGNIRILSGQELEIVSIELEEH